MDQAVRESTEAGRTLDVRSLADWIGIFGSAACAVHCIATPVLLLAGTALPASFAGNESFHRMMLWVVVPSSVVAFSLGCWRHMDRWVLGLGTLGLFGLSLPFIEPWGLVGETGERWVTVGSAGLLISAHLRNWRRCRDDDCEHRIATSG